MSEKREPVWVHCGKCGHEWAPVLAPMDAGLLARVLKSTRCPSCGAGSSDAKMGQRPKPTGDGDWRAWVGNGDTGTSSLTIWSIMTGSPSPHGRYGVPWDPDEIEVKCGSFRECGELLRKEGVGV